MAEAEQTDFVDEGNTKNGGDSQLSFTQDPDVNFDEPSAGGQTLEGGDTTGEDPNDDDDDDHRKLFVGGLSRDSESPDLKDYFSKFGEVTKCELKKDQETRRSRGFGFVVFKDAASVDKVLEETEHILQGKNIDPKKANPKKREPNLKVFVGGLDADTPELEIRNHFESFGKIADLELPRDMNEKRRRFCFVTFDSEDVVKKVVEKRMQTIGGKEVEVKKSVPRQDFRRGGYRGGWGYMGRGRGRGRGGWNQGYYGYGYGQGYGGYNQGYGNYSHGYGGYDNYYGYGQNYNGSGWGNYDQSHQFGSSFNNFG